MKININEIQRFCTHDGPGIRTTVFMSGCPLSCKWCHNPESKYSDNKIFFTESKCVNCKICENTTTVKSAVKGSNAAALAALAKEISAEIQG